MFTAAALITLICSAWFGNLAFEDAGRDFSRRPWNLNHVCADVVFIIVAFSGVVTALHSLVRAWL